MLQNIRDNSQGIIAKVIIGLIIGVFALFGVESIVGGFVNANTVAEVNGEEITQQQLASSVQNLIASIGGDIGSLDEQLLQQIALNQLIDDTLLKQSAKDAGMVISDDSIDRAIIRSPQFQVGGVFDNDLAVRTMATQGFTPQTYRATMAERMLMTQLANAYAASNFVTEAELEQLAALTLQTRDFRYLSVTLGTRTLGQAIPPEQIEAYYENNQDRFTVEEEVAIDYVVLDKNAIFDEVVVDETAVLAQYELEREGFESTAERRASHILLDTTSGELSETEAISQAQEIKARIDAGEDFATLAEELSDDVASAVEGGDIGYTDGSFFPEQIEEVLLTLAEGEVSDPVITEFGVHLVKLTEYEQSEFPSFENERARIERELKTTEVDSLYFARLETLANLAFETTGLQDISTELNLDIQNSDFFTRSGGNDAITSDSRIINAAFSDDVLVAGNNSDIIEFPDQRAVVLYVREHNEASVSPLAEVRGEIAVILRTELEQEKAREIGEQILAKLENGEPIDSLLLENELEWIEVEGATRNQAALNNEILQMAFSTPAPAEQASYNGAELANGTYVVLELSTVNPGSLATMDPAQKEQLKNDILDRTSRSVFDSYLANLRSNAEIEQNEALTNQLF
ncbi:MAG: SurA N-terminal domain-containing protein [Pseudomonadales bacterium]|nr:SurA N-terminal domain-containing protein [Pseudomonadales bacterium]